LGRLFGTDGVRGVANLELTAELAYKLGQAGAYVLTSETKHTPKILVGMDTRISGDMLEASLVAGLCSVGAEVACLGIAPTPTVAYLTRYYNADAGVVISASHNPYEFNGIKFFNSKGYKLSDALEERIESIILDNSEKIQLPTGEKIGRKIEIESPLDDYVNFIKSTIKGDLKGEKNIITAENLDKGEQIVLPKDPFRQDIYETEDRSLKRGYRIRSIFVRDGWCYYLKEILQTDGFQIYGIDLKDFKEELIYNGIQENDKNFFGAFFDRRQDQTSLPSVDYFFLNANYIYYLQGKRLVRIDRNTNSETVLALDVKERSAVYHNGDIYYIDTLNRLSVYKEEDETVNKIDSVYTDQISIEGKRIRYTDLLNDKNIGYYDIET